MKATAFIILAALIYTGAFAQRKFIKPKTGTTEVKAYLPEYTSLLKQDEFESFSYNSYLWKKDSLNLVSMANIFRQKLISIDSLVATRKSYRFEDTWLDFMITYHDGNIDTFIVNLIDAGKFRESGNFERFVRQLNLLHIQYALSHAGYAFQSITERLPMQVDYINRQIDEIRYDAGINSTAYASGLLKLIHKLLKENKSQLGVTSVTMYEDSFEPASLDIDGKITMREKFIRYVCTKINS